MLALLWLLADDVLLVEELLWLLVSEQTSSISQPLSSIKKPLSSMRKSLQRTLDELLVEESLEVELDEDELVELAELPVSSELLELLLDDELLEDEL